MRLALYQPDIAQNVGSMIRLCACFGIALDIIEPCGFPFDMKRIRQSALDYMEHVHLTRHSSWETYLDVCVAQHTGARLILLTTKGSIAHHKITYYDNDILLMGRESAGVPTEVANRADLRVRIPISSETRSLNVAQAATIVLSEALRQTEAFPQS